MKKTYEEPIIETIEFDFKEAITANDQMSSPEIQIMDGDPIDFPK